MSPPRRIHPLPSMQTNIDFIFVQFYNNPSCNLNNNNTTSNGAGFLTSLQSWSADVTPIQGSDGSSPFVDTMNGVPSPRVYVGAPAFPAAGSGWVEGEEFVRVLEGLRGLGLPNFGGVMLWDGAYGVLSARVDGVYGRTGVGRSYMRLVKDVLV